MKIENLDEDTLLDEVEGAGAQEDSMESVIVNLTENLMMLTLMHIYHAFFRVQLKLLSLSFKSCTSNEASIPSMTSYRLKGPFTNPHSSTESQWVI